MLQGILAVTVLIRGVKCGYNLSRTAIGITSAPDRPANGTV